MKRNHKTAKVLSAVLVVAACFAAWIVFTFLPGSRERLSLTAICLSIGNIIAGLVFAIITRLPDKIWVRITIFSLFGLLSTVPIFSVVAQRITYTRFGFTVYGAIPIPFLDITVNQHGFLWFRTKTHQITREELDALLAPGVEIVVVGIGWDSIAQLTEDAKRISTTVDLRVLPTPEAFALYNELKAQGRNVVLLAHSTC